jgi:glycosyltransferase involved in cell wall biosynthesis
MRVVIDTSPLKSAHKHRGIGSYTRSLVEALHRVDPENEYILTGKPTQADADLVHYPYFDFFFLSLPLIKSKPTVVTIHDTIPLIYPNEYPRGVRGQIKFLIQKRSLKSVREVITDSEQSRQDIVKYFHEPAERVHRIYLAADEQYRPLEKPKVDKVLEKYALRKPYFLYVGDINYNKNILGLIKAFSGLPPENRLVLISRALKDNIPQAREIHRLIEEKGLTGRVISLTKVTLDPKTDMTAIYQGAEWYIQPSFYEGFGLPVLEAIACGTPVIMSTGGALPEITPPGMITFNPHSVEAITEAMTKAGNISRDRKQQLINKAQQFARQFTWEKTAQQTIAVYRQALSLS